jgi:asparagine synthase (glutamine-hydrolysing)
LGVLLSGGIDSSLVVALMAGMMDEPVHTFSIGFADDATYDERGYARMVAEHFGTRHVDFEVRMDAVGLLDRLLWHHDQPFHDSSAIPTYAVCGLAREHVTVALNGDGGDEVFGGYDRFRAAALSRELPTPIVSLARRAAGLLPRDHGYFSRRRRLERFLERADAPVEERYQSWISVAEPSLLAELAAPGIATDDALDSMDRAYAAGAHLPVLDRILYANFRTYLPDDLAVKMDRMSMAHSLETRSPFLDTAVIEALGRIPARHKVGLRRLKPLLRASFGSGVLPEAIWDRPKHGFGVPMGAWFRGDLGQVLEDEVLATDARCAAVVRQDTVRRLYAEHRAGDHEHGFRLWTLLTLERWLRTIESPLRDAPPSTPALVDASPRSG